MNNLIAALSLALIAGCASTPSAVMEDGLKSGYTLKNSPELAATCMARNVEKHQFVGNVRRLDNSAYELTVRSELGVLFAYAVAEPQANGSQATVWRRSLWFANQSSIADTMTTGC